MTNHGAATVPPAAAPSAGDPAQARDRQGMQVRGERQRLAAAVDDIAVAELRARKKRSDKPFALMAASLQAIEKHLEGRVRKLLAIPTRHLKQEKAR